MTMAASARTTMKSCGRSLLALITTRPSIHIGLQRHVTYLAMTRTNIEKSVHYRLFNNPSHCWKRHMALSRYLSTEGIADEIASNDPEECDAPVNMPGNENQVDSDLYRDGDRHSRTQSQQTTLMKKRQFSDELTDLDEELLKSIEPYIAAELPPSPILAAYVDKSETLSNLVRLGVDLSQIDKRGTFKDVLIKLDFAKDVKDKIAFLHIVGVEDHNLGKFLTKNPFILTEDVQSLEARVNYLKSKKFTDECIEQIINRAPFFLNFSIKRLDNKLGFFQREFNLTGEETRQLITRTPKLVTGKLETVKKSVFSFKEQMRFSTKEFKELVMSQPRVLQTGRFKLLSTFDYLHNTVGIKHKQFVQFPQVFRASLPRIKERHQYLVKLDRAQYDPSKPGYIAMETLFKLPDELFCRDVAKTSVLDYNDFLKTL